MKVYVVNCWEVEGGDGSPSLYSTPAGQRRGGEYGEVRVDILFCNKVLGEKGVKVNL